MAVRAQQLSRSGARGKDLDIVVREQLQIIDDKLLRADRKWGRNVVAHNLPLAPALPGLSRADAQRVIYSAILRSLEKRGFEVKIVLEPARTTVYVAWVADLEAQELTAMNSLIDSKRIRPGELAAFCAAGTGACAAVSGAAGTSVSGAARPTGAKAGDKKA